MLPGSSGGDDGGEERDTARAEKERAKGGRDMEKSKKASSRVTALNQESAAANEASKSVRRGRAIGSSAVENAARRQFQKTQGKAIQGHIQARGQRQQAKRDAR